MTLLNTSGSTFGGTSGSALSLFQRTSSAALGIGLLAKTTTWTIPLKNKRDDIPDYHRAGCISLQAYCVECGKKVSA